MNDNKMTIIDDEGKEWQTWDPRRYDGTDHSDI